MTTIKICQKTKIYYKLATILHTSRNSVSKCAIISKKFVAMKFSKWKLNSSKMQINKFGSFMLEISTLENQKGQMLPALQTLRNKPKNFSRAKKLSENKWLQSLSSMRPNKRTNEAGLFSRCLMPWIITILLWKLRSEYKIKQVSMTKTMI